MKKMKRKEKRKLEDLFGGRRDHATVGHGAPSCATVRHGAPRCATVRHGASTNPLTLTYHDQIASVKLFKFYN